MSKPQLPAIPIDAPMPKVIDRQDFDAHATALLAWTRDPLFPSCALHTEAFRVECTVENETEGQFNEYEVTAHFLTGDRHPDWFNLCAALAGAFARNVGGDNRQKTSLVVNYTEDGFACMVKVIVPKLTVAFNSTGIIDAP
jgi:hypothetical protein